MAAIVAGACSPAPASLSPTPSSTGIDIEEHALKQAYCEEDMELRCLVPEQGSFEQILARHATQRGRPQEPSGGGPGSEVSVEIDGDLLLARLKSDGESREGGDVTIGEVQVLRNGQLIFSLSLGRLGPIPALQGLWEVQGHWVLEVVAEAGEESLWRGIIIRDGQSLLDSNDYDEAFGFTQISGRPFYFFARNGTIDISYDGSELGLAYDEVVHYACCSAARNNPLRSEDMVSYFARRGDRWYYVEAGRFE